MTNKKPVTQINTAGDLRMFLCQQLVKIESGSLDVKKASQITKMAEQVTSSIYSEMKMRQIQSNAGLEVDDLGDMKLGNSN